MWRLVVSAGKKHISFAICRPTRPADIRDERCDWRVDLKRPANLEALLQSDRFLLQVIAALHEKLPIREFALSGQSYARPEPRIKSVVLENPPKLVRSILQFSDDGKGGLESKPVSVFRTNPPEDAVWLIPAEPQQQQRLATMERFLREAGLEPVAPPVELPSGVTRLTATPNAQPATPPTIPSLSISQAPEQSQKPLAELERQRPLKAMELPPQKPAQNRPTTKANAKPQNEKDKPSVFAREEIIVPDDSEVVTLSGARNEENSEPAAPFFARLWDVLWPGLWQARFEWSGLPVPESERSRLPATQSVAMSGWHPIWKNLSIGASVRRISENEIVDLRISLPESALYQRATGRRTTTFVSGLLQADVSVLKCKVQSSLSGGLLHLNETWSYDRKRSTFELWSPSGRGTFVEPSLSFCANSGADGSSARLSYTSYRFDYATGWRLNIDVGWQWSIAEDWANWKPVKLSSLQGFVGVQRGLLMRSNNHASAQENDKIQLNAVNLGLRLNLDEVY